jgi:hypothetical protein
MELRLQMPLHGGDTMTDPYEHLRTPSAYDTMIRPLLAAKEAVEANIAAVGADTAEGKRLQLAKFDIWEATESIQSAHKWDGDEPRT